MCVLACARRRHESAVARHPCLCMIDVMHVRAGVLCMPEHSVTVLVEHVAREHCVECEACVHTMLCCTKLVCLHTKTHGIVLFSGPAAGPAIALSMQLAFGEHTGS